MHTLINIRRQEIPLPETSNENTYSGINDHLIFKELKMTFQVEFSNTV